MLTDEELSYFSAELVLHERKYLGGSNPRQQSGFARDERDWERFRRIVLAPVRSDGTFLDVGCANGLLMESAVRWALEDGYRLDAYGLDISARLAELARERLPQWRDRIFTGNALFWEPPHRFGYVRTEMVYVPPGRRREYITRLLDVFVAPGGRLIVCSYGSSRPEGPRAEPLIDDLEDWGLLVEGVHDVRSPDHGFVITRAVSLIPRPGADRAGEHIGRRGSAHPPVPVLNEGQFYSEVLWSDWIIQRHELRHHDLKIVGPSLRNLIDEVSSRDLQWAVLDVLEKWWRPMLSDPRRLHDAGYQPYAVLSMCRSLYTLARGEPASKTHAAQWGLVALPGEWSPLIRHALQWRSGDRVESLEWTQDFIRYAVERSSGHPAWHRL